MSSFSAWLEAKQARRDGTVSESLRSPGATRLVRLADASVAVAVVAGVALVVLVGLGRFEPALVLPALSLLALGVGAGAFAVSRLARLELADRDRGRP